MKDATARTGRRSRRPRHGPTAALLRPARWLAVPVLLAVLGALTGPATADPTGPVEPVSVRLRPATGPVSEALAARLRVHGGDRIRLTEQRADVTLALGDAAFRAALAAPGHGAVLGLGIGATRVLELVGPGCRCSAVRAGVPLAAQLAVLRELMPGARRVGVMLGPGSAWRAPLAGPVGLLLDVVEVDPPQRLGPLLRRHLPDWDALLLPEDPVLFGPGTARLVLLTSYRQRVPVFGPGADYVHAGSVASAAPDNDDLARAALDWLGQWRATGQWPAPDFAGHYGLEINDYVARAYDLKVGPGGRLERRLEIDP